MSLIGKISLTKAKNLLQLIKMRFFVTLNEKAELNDFLAVER